MANEPRFVFDTNVVISALLMRQSIARQAFDRATQTGKLLVSHVTVGELNDVLQRKGFERYITGEERMEFLSAFVRDGILVEIVERVVACRDPKDEKFLELAVNGKAACMVSGDKDLLVLHPFRGTAIVTPRQFVEFPL
ncbi:putative toxin-antitoxin system toxin component, PIN family [Chloracidobacterium aggregatum]|uniref:Toxin-antitoxin system toxin component, PIN family n=1 Tax=Chloracidobacterium sp. N TaxID=2821540 RepID=A0ABX8B1U5_9BACT|nr:putative toxin-antitoxin system toxin component, PIN family [Chloracidobacterium aggregatum]QUV84159.1 putative toxin-antitoxin system toxin component, PIN family [Chloracidobacterium sp. 2]QUV87356.1 putative toxin-antitoxin system toxin component, PIN family [Chloracidobacterium sp. S]QUV90260.1 putative toxin-antitoxin system toxin component, PIN family [Chloracidobacterium sp. A]QUV93471.1 putative toxin-antitoxin system toxin component, PIN family [Chloracidobacterium sp. N]QUV96627.1 